MGTPAICPVCGRDFMRSVRTSGCSDLCRFLSRIVIDDAGCWLWQGAISVGYGRFTTTQRTYSAHRYAYEAFVGPIPEGLQLDHLCRVTRCANPAHLEPVTNRVNALRGERAQRTHCPARHLYDAANTYVDGRGHRHCRACKREQARITYHSQKRDAS